MTQPARPTTSHARSARRQTQRRWWSMLLLLAAVCTQWSGCAACRPLDGIPLDEAAVPLPRQRRSGRETIDLSLLRRDPPLEHRVDAGDVLGIFIEGVLGDTSQPLPTYVPGRVGLMPSLGYPVEVRPDGTISLPYTAPIFVRGMTIAQVETAVRRRYTVEQPLLQPGRDRILVSLQQPRVYKVLVIRQEAGNPLDGGGLDNAANYGFDKRGTGRTVHLPAFQNDVLHALAETGGLPGLDAENVIYVIRNGADCYPSPPAGGGMIPLPVLPPQFPPHASRGPGAGRAGGPSAVVTADHYAPPGGTGAGHTVPAVPEPMGLSRGVRYTSYRSLQQPPAGNPLVPPDPSAWAPAGLPGMPPGNGAWAHPWPVPPVGWDHWSPADLTVRGGQVIRIPLRLAPGEVPQFGPEDVILHNGDIVFIESRETEHFYTGGLLGGGRHVLPRDYDLDLVEAISVVEATGSADRPTRAIGGASILNQDVTVGASRVIIHRRRPDGSRVALKVNLYDALANPNRPILIQPGDRIYLRYTHSEAMMAFLERHLFEGAVIGAASSLTFGD